MRFTRVTLFHLSVKGCLLYFRFVVLQGKDWKLAGPRNNKRRLKEGVATLRLGIMDKKYVCVTCSSIALFLFFFLHTVNVVELNEMQKNGQQQTKIKVAIAAIVVFSHHLLQHWVVVFNTVVVVVV